MHAFRIQPGLSLVSRILAGAGVTNIAKASYLVRTTRSTTIINPLTRQLNSSLSSTHAWLVAPRFFTTGSQPVTAWGRQSGAAAEEAPDIYTIDPDYLDENGMNRQEREKIEKWAASFTKDQIPKGLLTINFVRASGPGGQNVNKVNTKVDMRFSIDEALWLPPYVREQLKTKEANKVNRNGELVLQSDAKRTQMANLEDCMGKLYDLIMETAELPKLPDPESLARLERLKKAGDNRRKANKQFHSQKKSNRRVSRDD